MSPAASPRTSKSRTNPAGLLLGLALLSAIATAASAGCGGISVGDQSCTEDSKVNDKEDDCPYGPPGGPKVAPGGCPNIVVTDDPLVCTKSWDDIFPILTGPAGNCSLGGCHGDAPGARGIHLPANDPNAFYDELKGYVGSQGYPYINDKDPARSWILCNLAGTPGGGSPMPPPSGLSPEDLMIIQEWAQCGLRKSLPGDGGI